MIERALPPTGPLQIGGIVPRGTRVNVFDTIFQAFLVLGTIVGVVVIAYALWNAYKYRAGADAGKKGDGDRPQLGEIPQGGGGGKKLLLSFSLSAIIVISLVIWTYGTLLYVENAAAQGQAGGTGEALDVEVTGFQFGWRFTYPNGYQTSGTLRVPVDRTIRIEVTSDDVFHNFGVPGLRVKTDAMPGQTTKTWFRADQTGTYEAQCYELCGAGHSYMTAEVVVMEPQAFQDWYENTASG